MAQARLGKTWRREDWRAGEEIGAGGFAAWKEEFQGEGHDPGHSTAFHACEACLPQMDTARQIIRHGPQPGGISVKPIVEYLDYSRL